ncbi:MAG: hypothetical protein CSA11_10785 [Chloroflexi bacterium]|nr:MAG: hypothetical protein CSB13_03775 [Chloroflexota bacterium]PIE79786.1 MAG: hypothetical protein CSA11_10785 [Chloroflexota bacterium]
MAKKSKKRKKKQTKQESAAQDAEIKKAMDEPWIEQRAGIKLIALLSVAFGLFMTWQLQPSEGLWPAVLWGLGSTAAIWIVFLLAFGFNKLVRR